MTTAAVEPEVVIDTAAVDPHYDRVQIFVNNRKFGATNGCTSGFSPQPTSTITRIKHGISCGHRGAVSKLNWEYVRSDDEGDHYRVERIFPHGEPGQESKAKDVVFQGEELVLFEDDLQRIVMRQDPPQG